jgi:hypothetical protein
MPVYVSQSPSCVFNITQVDYEYGLNWSIHYAINKYKESTDKLLITMSTGKQTRTQRR